MASSPVILSDRATTRRRGTTRRSRPSTPAVVETVQWESQARAAAIAGCSVAAIRKWRRAGDVAERVTTTPGGRERVQVRVEDVVTRAKRTARTGEQPAAVAEPALPVVTLKDLNTLIRRIGNAERRAAHAEATLQASEIVAGLLRERLADLQQRVDDEQARAARAEARLRNSQPDVERLAAQLRRLRVRARERGGSNREEHFLERASYDGALLAACAMLRVPTKFTVGETLRSEDRAGLASALAGIGVRL